MLLDLLLQSAIRPQFDRGVARTCDHFQCLTLPLVILLRQVTGGELKEVHGPDLFLVHLERVLALLLAVVPNLNDAIDTSCRDLQASVEPCSFDQGLRMPLERCKALASADVPHFAHLVARGRDKQLFRRRELNVPDSTLVSFQCFLEGQGVGLPYIDALILAGRGDELVVWCDSDRVDVFLMRHDCHVC